MNADSEKNSDNKTDSPKADDSKKKETVKDVIDSMTPTQREVTMALIGQAFEEGKASINNDETEGGKEEMKHNVFEQDAKTETNFLSHADQENIIKLAKANNVGSLQTAISIYNEENDSLAHGIDDIEALFPEYKDVRPGAPELIERDQG